MALYHLDCVSFIVWFSCLGHEDLFFCTLSVWACEIWPSFYFLWNIIWCWGSVTGLELVWRQWAAGFTVGRECCHPKRALCGSRTASVPCCTICTKERWKAFLMEPLTFCSSLLESHSSSVMYSPLVFFPPLFSVCNHLLTFRLHEFHVISSLLSLVNRKLTGWSQSGRRSS